MALKECIRARTMASSPGAAASTHVPYRRSKLTLLLNARWVNRASLRSRSGCLLGGSGGGAPNPCTLGWHGYSRSHCLVLGGHELTFGAVSFSHRTSSTTRAPVSAQRL